MPHTTSQQFLRFLHEELCLSADSIAIAQRSMNETKGPLPMLLWQYGLINLDELEVSSQKARGHSLRKLRPN
ncbi:DUF2949 domain-containing protein, partial [Crocosphaera sp. Alani8]|uniref:DUF2949 domain-containing protein n=1 Tax=Crocosphaera sp. Alani8 TaxID=3038952 RepID=UPI00313D3013